MQKNLDIHAPIKKIQMKVKSKSGMTKEMIKLIEQRNTAQKVASKSKDIEDIRYARN